MPFTPPEDLGQLTDAAIQNWQSKASEAKNALIASGVTAETVTDEQIAELESIQNFQAAAATELATRKDRAAKFSTLTAEPTPEPTPEPVVEPEPVVAAAEPAVEPEPVVAPSIAAVAHAAPTDTRIESVEVPKYGTLVAAAGADGLVAGTEITSLDVTKALIAANVRFEASAGTPGQIKQPIALVRRDYPEELTVFGDNSDQEKLMRLADERNLNGGSLIAAKRLRREELRKQGTPEDALVAAGGWCAPSETIYTTCFQTSNDGMYDVPEMNAPRGGVRHNTGLDWTTVYGGGNILAAATGVTGFFNLTEAQVQAGSPTKTNIQVACPSFVDDRLGVTGTWITSPILTNRGYPEFVNTFMEGAAAVHQHQVNALALQAVATASTPVTLAAVDPWQSDGSVTSNLLAALEMAVVDIKYRLRLQRGATLEVVFPYWVLAQFRADLSRRLGFDQSQFSVADSMIESWMAQRGVSPQFVYDWQDSFSSSTTGLPGSATAITTLPTTVQFMVYPAGTWIKAVQDVITLNALYDSTLLATNMVTQLFMESGWKMLQMCPISRIYTVPVCPSGSTTAGGTVDCVTP